MIEFIREPVGPLAMVALWLGLDQQLTALKEVGTLVDVVRDLIERSNVPTAFGLSLPPIRSGMSKDAIHPNKRSRSYSQLSLRQSYRTPLRTSSRPRENSGDRMIISIVASRVGTCSFAISAKPPLARFVIVARRPAGAGARHIV
jgi:hypothetical protein